MPQRLATAISVTRPTVILGLVGAVGTVGAAVGSALGPIPEALTPGPSWMKASPSTVRSLSQRRCRWAESSRDLHDDRRTRTVTMTTTATASKILARRTLPGSDVPRGSATIGRAPLVSVAAVSLPLPAAIPFVPNTSA